MLAFGSQKMQFPENTELFHSGQSSDGAYVVISGEIGIHYTASRNDHKIEKIGVGGMIGELSLIVRNNRVGTAIVLQSCEVLKIRREIMHRILEEYPELAVELHRRISTSVVAMGKEIEKAHRRLQQH